MLVIKEIRKVLWSKFIDIAVWIADKRPVMKYLVKNAERKLCKDIVEDAQDDIRAAQELKYAFVRNLLKTTEAHLATGRMSKDVFHKMVKVFVRNVFVEDISAREIASESKRDAVYPCFLVLSPTQVCNLSCPGCYASSSSNTRYSLPYSVVSRIINEKGSFGIRGLQQFRERNSFFGKRLVKVSLI